MKKYFPLILSAMLLGLTFQILDLDSHTNTHVPEKIAESADTFNHQTPLKNVSPIDVSPPFAQCQDQQHFYLSIACNRVPQQNNFDQNRVGHESATIPEGM